MLWWQNIPLFQILLPLLSSSILAAAKPKLARAILICVASACCLLSSVFLYFMANYGGSYTIAMGEFGAPFGNELHISTTEAVVSLLFCFVLLFSVLGGMHRFNEEIHEGRRGLFCAVSALLLTAITAITYTNDLFTGYVFLEITTIAAGALIFVRSREGSLFAAMRYMIMNLIGSGLFLLGLTVLYCLTGHLLFPQLKQSALIIAAEGRYIRPFILSILLMTLGLAIKSALYPFHTWLPNAYAGATPAASSMLASLVSKAYIFLYVKIVLRGVGLQAFLDCGVNDVLLVYSLIAILMGSIDAIREHNVRRMVAYSSVAQIGYIFLGVSLGTEAGIAAAVFHICAHSVAKAMLFPAVDRLTQVSGGNENYRDLRGSGFRAPLAGAAFVVGAFSVTGIPFLGGFASKVYLCAAAAQVGSWRMVFALSMLAVSTLLNVIYFLRTVITLYRPGEHYPLTPDTRKYPAFRVSMVAFIAANILVCLCASPIMHWILGGIAR